MQLGCCGLPVPAALSKLPDATHNVLRAMGRDKALKAQPTAVQAPEQGLQVGALWVACSARQQFLVALAVSAALTTPAGCVAPAA